MLKRTTHTTTLERWGKKPVQNYKVNCFDIDTNYVLYSGGTLSAAGCEEYNRINECIRSSIQCNGSFREFLLDQRHKVMCLYDSKSPYKKSC